MQRIKYSFLAVCLVCGAVALTVLAFELAFLGYKERYRVWQDYGPFRLHAQRIYAMAPGYTRTWKAEEFSETLISNQAGLRGPELRQGPRTWTRVLLLGDSFTYGHGASNDETYPAKLAELFDRYGNDVEVVNAGMPGYGTDQQYAYYTQELHLLEPDVLILNLNGNDISDNIGRALYTVANGELVSLDATRSSLYFISNLHHQSPKWLQSSHLFNYLTIRMNDKDLFGQLPNLDGLELISWSEQKIFLSLLNLKRLLGNTGRQFVVVTMPSRKEQSAYGFVEPVLRKEEIPYLDLSADPVWSQQNSGLWYEIDGHPNVEGYAHMAQSIHQFLLSSTDAGK